MAWSGVDPSPPPPSFAEHGVQDPAVVHLRQALEREEQVRAAGDRLAPKLVSIASGASIVGNAVEGACGDLAGRPISGQSFDLVFDWSDLKGLTAGASIVLLARAFSLIREHDIFPAQRKRSLAAIQHYTVPDPNQLRERRQIREIMMALGGAALGVAAYRAMHHTSFAVDLIIQGLTFAGAGAAMIFSKLRSGLPWDEETSEPAGVKITTSQARHA
jgi:hypothetical protein